MTSAASNVQDALPSPPESVTNFPTEARVILQGLLKAPDLNGKKGVVRSVLSSAGRHTVYIKELDKCVGLKPSNLRYEPILLESLSVKELKMVLKYKNQQPADISGMEKLDLQARVSKLVSSSEELPESLAKAKTDANDFSSTTDSHSHPTEELSNMSPDQLRQQARVMKTMDPSTVRRMNPQLANMTDSQLKMAADQMEMMANNPSMMKMAAEQMKNMDPTQLQKMQAKMAGGISYNNNTASTDNNSSSTTATDSAGFATPSVNQAQQVSKMMQNMDPEQLRHQAQMLKTMDPDMLRRTNPQLAHMSDAQIKMAANQFEMMASNPAMMKMAMDQMRNATPEQLEAMSKGQKSSSGSTGIPSPAYVAQMGGDPTEMLTNMDTTQLKEMLNTVKDNPEMMKQFAGMAGISEDKLKQGVESFAGMDDAKIGAALKMMKTAQKAKKTWNQVDAKASGHLRIIILVMMVLVIVWVVWYFFLTVQSKSTVNSTVFSEDQNYATGDDLESEF